MLNHLALPYSYYYAGTNVSQNSNLWENSATNQKSEIKPKHERTVLKVCYFGNSPITALHFTAYRHKYDEVLLAHTFVSGNVL